MAGAYFYARVIANTDSDGDAGHLPAVLLADPRIPDRSTHLVYGGTDPLPWLTSGVVTLQKAGAEVIAIPCNTAHAYLSRMSVSRGFVADMPRLTVRAMQAQRVNRIGLLSTRGTVLSGVYRIAAEEADMELLALPWETNISLEELIYRQKAGETVVAAEYIPYVERLLDMGADAVVLGCTEISAAFSGRTSPQIVDALEILAKEVIVLCGGRVKEEKRGTQNDIWRAFVG